MLELLLLFLILLGIYIIIKIIKKFLRLIFKINKFIGERLVVRKFIYTFRRKKLIFINKITNYILTELKKKPEFYSKYSGLFKKLDFYAVTLKFWWVKKNSKKKVLYWSIFIIFFFFTYYYISKILLLTIPQFLLVVLDLIIRFIWIFFLRGNNWRNQTFEEKVKDYENFRKGLYQKFRDFFGR